MGGWISKILPERTVLCWSHYLKNQKPKLKILKATDTINYIKSHNCSVARFGEGEFELILWPERNLGFQEHNAELAERLKQVLSSQNSELLICIPYALNQLWGRTEESVRFWYYWSERKQQRERIVSLIKTYHNKECIFGDTQISRPYIAWKSPRNAEIMFPRLKSLWQGKDILIVEGEKTRLGVGNDLLNEAKSVKRILCPVVNAFSHCDEILSAIEENRNDNELVILALGPTATVLAFDLCERGIRAIDIGHLDIEYEWYLRGMRGHDLIPGKYTNEAERGNNVDECLDEQYLSQVIARVAC